MDSVGLSRRKPAALRPARVPGQPALPPADRVEAPRLLKVRWLDGQLVALPQLLTGQTVEDVEDVEELADRLRVTAGARRCRIIGNESLTGYRIVWSFGDPLAQPFDALVPAADAVPTDLRSVLPSVSVARLRSR